MDIKKEREAFEAWLFREYPDAIDFMIVYRPDENIYEHRPTQVRWEAWQAAKAQAVPEVLKKFCNEHKEPAWRGRLTEYDKGYSDCCIAVLEMIEAQQPSGTSGCPDEP